MQDKNKHETNRYWGKAVILLVLFVGFIFLLMKSFDFSARTDEFTLSEDPAEKVVLTKLDKERLLTEQYDGVFLKMHDLSQFTEQCFEEYRGLHVICPEGMIYTADEMLEALNLIFSNARLIPEMYFEVEPYELWISAGADDKTREDFFASMLSYIDNHPETTFEFAYSFPYLEFWSNITEQELSDRQEVYYYVTSLLRARSNVFVYAPGNYEWLIANAANYDTTFVPNTECLLKVMLYMFCDRVCQLNPDDVADWFNKIKDIVESNNLGTYSYRLSEGTKLVFVGDSILDYYRQSYGIPGVVAFFTGAKTYNLGKGGLSGAGDEKNQFSLSYMTEGIVNRSIQPMYQNTELEKDFQTFASECSTEDKLTFVIMIGINDFLNNEVSFDSEDKKSNKTTYGGLVSAVSRIKEIYPNSEIVLISEYKLDSGEGFFSPDGEVLTGEDQRDYVDAVRKAAEECGCDYLNLYEEANINENTFSEMLRSDHIHPTESGEFEIAKVISKFLHKRDSSY